MSKIKTKYHYFYKITNKINNHFYYGVHNTNNLDDGYMGSGKRLHIAYKKYGIENFEKEILKFFNTTKEAFEFESEIVTDNLVKDINCYNLVPGGKGGWEFINKNFRFVKDKNGNHLTVSKDDPRYLTGELIHYDKGIERLNLKNHFIAKDKSGNFYFIENNDPRYLSGELVGHSKETITVKDKNNNTLKVSIYDSRYLNGELIPLWKNKKHSEETKLKMRKSKQENHPQLGEKNSQYGTCWIHNNKENKKIPKDQLSKYENLGWVKGRKMIFNMG